MSENKMNKPYKKHHHHRGPKPPKKENVTDTEVIGEAVESPSRKVEKTEESNKANPQKQSGQGHNRNDHGRGKRRNNRKGPENAEAGAETKSTSEIISELNDIEENESVDELLMLDGGDDVDLVAEEGESEQKTGEEEAQYEVVGVRFGSAAKTYYFDPSDMKITVGQGVIVETVRGDKYGICSLANCLVSSKNVFLPLKKVLRIATERDKVVNEENIALSDEAFKLCNQKIAEHGLEMKLIDAVYTHDRSKLIFFFTAPTRVDFRELVKDLASLFKTRIDLRQIGIRDEAKIIGGYGICGRPLCCCSFLPNFNQVSIKMAKEQNLSLNTSKISGVCGRLMCCLKFEHKTYQDEMKLMPPIGSVVKTADGTGTVVEQNPISGNIKVRLNDQQDSLPKSYHKDSVSVIKRGNDRSTEGNGEEDSSD